MIVFSKVINSYVVTTVFLVLQPSIFILPHAPVTFPYNRISFLPVKKPLPNLSARGCKVVTGASCKQLG